MVLTPCFESGGFVDLNDKRIKPGDPVIWFKSKSHAVGCDKIPAIYLRTVRKRVELKATFPDGSTKNIFTDPGMVVGNGRLA